MSLVSVERKTILIFIVIGTFLVIGIRLFQMQIVNHELYDTRSANNSIEPIVQTPLRGVFLDRNGELLVSNVPAYTVRITPSKYKKDLNKVLETVLDLNEGFIKKILDVNKHYSKHLPVRIKRGINFEQVAWLEENSEHLPGVDYVVEMQRGYPAGIRGAHLFGYTKEISPAALEKDKENNYYKPGDYVGNSGIEKTYEKIIRGEKGFNYVLVDANRKPTGKYKDGRMDKVSIKGHDLVLSIDADVQRAAEEGLKGRRGAVVAIDPKTGEVLAMASAPDYDLNNFSYVTPRSYLEELYTDKDKPLFNRATMSLKPPGSTFKILAAMAALDMGIIDENSTIFCGGSWFFGRSFKCHGAHGAANVYRAIEGSCNVFFYQLIYKIGLDNLMEYGRKFGFAHKTGIDLVEEVGGFLPSTKFYEKMYGKNWPRSILASVGIGQGEVSVTPMQLAYYTALIANNGKTFKPHLVKGYMDDITKKLVPLQFEAVDLKMKKKVFDIVKEGMYYVVNRSGTAGNIRMEDIKIAGKTGTSQNPHGADHAFFIGFAPYDDPKICYAIVVENVGFGATWAAPIAKSMTTAYLQKDKLKKEKLEVKPEEKTEQMITQAKVH